MAAPAIRRLPQFLHALAVRLVEIQQRLAVLRNEGVEIDQLRDAIAGAIGDAGRDHAAIAVAEQHDVAQILELDDVDHILDMGVEIDRRIHQMHALAKSGVGRRDQPMAGRLHQRMHLLPRPAATPHRDRRGRSCVELIGVSMKLLLKASIAIVPAGGLV